VTSCARRSHEHELLGLDVVASAAAMGSMTQSSFAVPGCSASSNDRADPLGCCPCELSDTSVNTQLPQPVRVSTSCPAGLSVGGVWVSHHVS